MVKRAGVIFIAFLAVATMIGFAVSRPFGGTQGSNDAMRAPSAELGGMTEGSGASTVSADAAPESLDTTGTAVSELPGLPPLGQAVVKTGDLMVEVRKGSFSQAFDDASLVAGTYGGYVESSSVSAFASPPMLVIQEGCWSGSTFFEPLNIMCSKRWANPVRPGFSFFDPT